MPKHIPEPTPTPPEAQEPLEPGQQVLLDAFKGQLTVLRESLASNGTSPEQTDAIYARIRDEANRLLREQGINAELT